MNSLMNGVKRCLKSTVNQRSNQIKDCGKVLGLIIAIAAYRLSPPNDLLITLF